MCTKVYDIALQALLAKGANIEERATNGSTSLIHASKSGHLPVVEVRYPF